MIKWPSSKNNDERQAMSYIHRRLIAVFLTVQCFVVIQLLTYMQLDSTLLENSSNRQLSSSHPFPSLRTDDATIVTSQHSANKQKIMYFLHIHKSGGHSICLQAQENKMIGDYNNVCNVQKDQHCCGGEDSLQAQIEFAKNTNFTFVAAEREMYDAMTTEYYDYVVVLRDSKSRYQSHWKHLVSNANTYSVSPYTGDKVHDRFMIPMHGVRYSVGNRTKWWQSQPDNYNVRMICGTKCLEVPKFQITRKLFIYTLQRLDDFAHVMFLEDMQRSFNLFAKNVGWKNPANSSQLHQNAKGDNPSKFDSLPVENAWDPFMSVLDDALYDHARQKYQARLSENVSFGSVADQALVNDYFDNGPGRMCQNPCCGECSIW
ncbi:hypothetical protein IV203_034768 [Nitzschia inconspicua]|uniref:Uncharacterized protein n=1 Tax=Nitzschia inconspicua TaxID=303405 RepID=A0A9K3LDA6_9STRA|nr:hypothetical protein IV203_000023 [Nitzschia inconspicua]KAG7359670.1 hypothetical protein IV203_034768 [Nitzschia inconspicua]